MSIPTQSPLGYSQLSVTTAAGLGTVPAGATVADITVEGAAVRWRADGTNPTTSVGMPIADGGSLTYKGPLSALKIIAQTGTATVNVSFYATRSQ